MPFAEPCPKCGKSLNAPDSMAGKRVRCLQCQTVFTLAGTNGVRDRVAAGVGLRPDGEQAAEGKGSTRTVRAAFLLGVASLVLGLGAAVCGFFPATASYCRALAWVGILLGGSAVVLSILREECGFGFPFAGSVASLLSLALVAFWLSGRGAREGTGRAPGGMGQGPPPGPRAGPGPNGKGGSRKEWDKDGSPRPGPPK